MIQLSPPLLKEFKQQLLDFIDDLEEPFSINFLAEKCLQPIRKELIHEVLCEFEKEGHVVFVGDGMWITTKVLIKRALNKTQQIQISSNLIAEVITFLIKHPELGYSNIKDFIKDAILHTIQKTKI